MNRKEIEAELINIYVSKTQFNRKKNRTKPWIFRCHGCGGQFSDEELPYYWTRGDGDPFCSEACARTTPLPDSWIENRER